MVQSTELSAWQCKNCRVVYLQKGLAEWCCSDEQSRCAWEGCTEPRDKQQHSVYCTSHHRQCREQRALERLMKAEPVDYWTTEEESEGPFCYGESWYNDIESLVDDRAQEPDWTPEDMPEWEYCVKLARPSIDLMKWLEAEDENFGETVDDCEDLSIFPLTPELSAQIDNLQAALNDHWKSHTSGVWVYDRRHRWPLRQQVMEWVAENIKDRE